MGRRFKRRELYDLVWSQPMRTVAAGAGVSDVALAKACRKADIPVPERGYWARKQAGRPTIQRPLPPRFPGASDEIEVGGRSWDPDWQRTLLNGPLPPPPIFDEDMAAVTERVRKMVGKVTCPRNFTNAHPLIATLLEQDEKRRADYVRTGYSWYAPLYDSPREKRRLRILNAIFMAVQRIGCKPSMNTSLHARNDREVSIHIGHRQVSFVLEPVARKGRASFPGKPKERLRLAIHSRRATSPSLKSWADTDETPLEELLGTMVLEILVAAETFHRESVVEHHGWMVKRRAELEEEAHRRKAEEERAARELREKQEKERIGRLIAQATALHQSNAIRTYVQAVLSRSTELPVAPDQLDRWVAWALNEADRIEPVKNGTVLEAVEALADSSAEDAGSRDAPDASSLVWAEAYDA